MAAEVAAEVPAAVALMAFSLAFSYVSRSVTRREMLMSSVRVLLILARSFLHPVSSSKPPRLYLYSSSSSTPPGWFRQSSKWSADRQTLTHSVLLVPVPPSGPRRRWRWSTWSRAEAENRRAVGPLAGAGGGVFSSPPPS